MAESTLSAAELYALYESYLPDKHVELSCVYHGAHGCALPRAFRSNTCNRYLCGGLTQLSRTLHETGGEDAIFGLSDNEALLALTYVRGTTMAPVDMLPTGPATSAD
jgi:hypothetical protein